MRPLPLFFYYHFPFRTHVIPYAQPWRGRIPPYHDLYNRPVVSYCLICLRLTPHPLLIAMSSRRIGGIERPFVLIVGLPMLIKALYFVWKNSPFSKRRIAFARISSWLLSSIPHFASCQTLAAALSRHTARCRSLDRLIPFPLYYLSSQLRILVSSTRRPRPQALCQGQLVGRLSELIHAEGNVSE
jgi:hypothetical protein